MSTFDNYLKKIGEVGHVHSVNRVLVYCSGLGGAKIGEKVYFEDEQMGFVYAIGADLTEVLLLDVDTVQLGSMVVRTGETLMVEASSDLLGKILDPFGIPLGKKVHLTNVSKRYLETPAPLIIDRVRINQNLETGVTLVDVLIPIGRGQRQLVIGDQKTGKTNFLVQTIARQAQLGTVCIYVFVGKKKSDLTSTIEKLKKLGAMEQTIIIAAPSSIPTSLIYLAPFTAFAIAEFFKDQGRDVLLIIDEISRHAKYYRELSILSRKMPGRDGYPGDIFYLHSHLMERAGRFLSDGDGKNKVGQTKKEEQTLTLKIEGKTSSITCLPVVETLNGDFTGYTQTNLMSMTDGHVFFDMNQFQQGVRPAININLSVTRTGKQTHKTIERDIALKVRQILFEYTQARDVAKFGVELIEATQDKIRIGDKLMAVFDQESDVIVPKIVQLLYIEMLLSGFWEESGLVEIKAHKAKILAAVHSGKIDKLIGKLQNSFDLGSLRSFEGAILEFHIQLKQITGGTGGSGESA
ncbi:hypothetical protein HY024_00355 [Candidatus Curtissbacteria bacterium]|nr:hypothetical protein [Candidatus Curtissbacteria bacterium]